MNKFKIIKIQKNENFSNKEIFSTLRKLSKCAERHQRNGKDKDNSILYINDSLAGAYYLNNKTIITNGYWGIVLNNLVADLTMAKNNDRQFDLPSFLSKIKIDNNWENISLDMGLIKQLNINSPTKTMRFGSLHFPVEQVYMIAKCIENRNVFVHKTELMPMIIKGTNGTGLIMPMKPEYVSEELDK